MSSQSPAPAQASIPPTSRGSKSDALRSALASALYPTAILACKSAVTTGRRTLLLTGGDFDARRAVASLALPNTVHESCLLAGADGGRALLSLGASTGSPLIIHDADAPHASATLVALLDSSPTRPLIATASSADSVPSELRRAHRLDAHVRLTPAGTEERERGWGIALPILCPAIDEADKGRLVRELAKAAPAFGLRDVMLAAGSHLAADRPADVTADAAMFLAGVEASRPRRSALPFAVAGPGRRAGSGADGWGRAGGYESQKRQLLRALSLAGAQAGTLARLGTRPPRGVLLHGPRGVGKSLLARSALSLTSGTNSLIVSGPDLYSPFLGESERRVRSLFVEARSLSPCIVLIDDVDAVAADRSAETAGGGTGVERRVLGALLAELDGVGSGDGVALLACAANVEGIDAALLRPGRIDVMVELPVPGEEDRCLVLEAILRGMPVDGRGDLVGRIARETEGVCAAGLEGVCRRAAMIAMEEADEPEVVLQRHFLAAVAELEGG